MSVYVCVSSCIKWSIKIWLKYLELVQDGAMCIYMSIISDGIVPCESRVVTSSEVTLLSFLNAL